MDNLVGQVITHYKIVSLLGEGGMGAVYKAQDITLQREVAFKIMHSQFSSLELFRERFLREARAAARLDHPGIVKVFEFGQTETQLFIVMEFITGDSLRKRLDDLQAAKKWIDLPEALQIVRQVALALDYAHQHGVLHRDIKPSNILLKPGKYESLPYQPVMTDLGLAKLLEGQPITQDGTAMGTPAYMSPEQALGEDTDPRSDVYSLGVLLFEMAVGRLPFPANTLTQAIRYHTQEPPPRPRSIRPDLPETIEKIILKTLEKAPANRFQSAGELAEALQTGSLPTQSGDQIQLFFNGKYQRSILVQKDTVTVGSQGDNDIILNDSKASAHHARIVRKGGEYSVIDLHTDSGTSLGNVALLPEAAEAWRTGVDMHIGDTALRLVSGGAGSNPVNGLESLVASSQPAQPTKDKAVDANSGGIWANPIQLNVDPGKSVTTTITVMNQGSLVDQYQFKVEGIPTSWMLGLPEHVDLMPQEKKILPVVIQPPHVWQSRAGRYQFVVRMLSEVNPSQRMEIRLTLTVNVYSEFTSELDPVKIKAGASGRVTVTNRGNSKQVFTVQHKDRGEEVVFEPPAVKQPITEGQAATLEFQARPKQRKILGSQDTYQFTSKVTSPTGESQIMNGEITSKPILPMWSPVLFSLLCLLLVGGIGLLFAVPYIEKALTQPTATIAIALILPSGATSTPGFQPTAQSTLAPTLRSTVKPSATEPPSAGPTNTPHPSNVPSDTPTASATPVPSPTDTFTPAPTPLGGGTGNLTFWVLPKGGGYQLVLESANGSSAKVLATNANGISHPAWSPNGHQIAYTLSSAAGKGQIFLVNVSDGKVTALTDNPDNNDRMPAFSPDGKKLAFVSARDGNDEIYVEDLATRAQTRLTANDVDDINPTWSPDGFQFAFSSNRTMDFYHIFLMNADGTNVRQLTTNASTEYAPTWSPDGKQITYNASIDANLEIYVMDADGGNVRRLTNNKVNDYFPSWSPDSQMIAFVSDRDGNAEIYTMGADGSNPIRITKDVAADNDPAWQPVLGVQRAVDTGMLNRSLLLKQWKPPAILPRIRTTIVPMPVKP